MNKLQVIDELCRICSMQARIIAEQAKALEQLGAVVMEEEREEVSKHYRALGEDLGSDAGLV